MLIALPHFSALAYLLAQDVNDVCSVKEITFGDNRSTFYFWFITPAMIYWLSAELKANKMQWNKLTFRFVEDHKLVHFDSQLMHWYLDTVSIFRSRTKLMFWFATNVIKV